MSVPKQSEDAFVKIICGNLGGGKTLHAVRSVVDQYLPKGSVIFANVDFQHDKIADYLARRHGVKFNPSQLVHLGDDISTFSTVLRRGVSGVPNLLLYDESQLDFTALGYKENRQQKKAELELIAQARKLDLDMIFVSQDERDIDVVIRRRSRSITDCTNFQNLPSMGWFFKLIRCPLHKFETYTLKRGEVQKGAKPKVEMWQRDVSICECYDTKGLHGRFRGIESETFEVEYIDSPKPKKSKFMKPLIFLVLALIGVVVWQGCSSADSDVVPVESAVVPLAEAPVAVSSSSPLYVVGIAETGRQSIVNFSDGSSRVFPFLRHVAGGLSIDGAFYPLRSRGLDELVALNELAALRVELAEQNRDYVELVSLKSDDDEPPIDIGRVSTRLTEMDKRWPESGQAVAARAIASPSL